MRALHLFVAAAVLAVPASVLAQRHEDRRHKPQPPKEAAVDFGVLPADPAGTLVPIGPPPCLQTGGIGGPGDPCSYKLHVLLPDEVRIREEGEVTYQFHGGGHAIAIYKVSRNTSRSDVGFFLCPGLDPADAATPLDQPCNPLQPGGVALANQTAEHIVLDGRGRVVLVAAANPTNANVHPLNRVWSPDDRLMSAGGIQFMNGGTLPAGAPSNGQLVTFRFLEEGRYLVICMNRSHFLNDWMFGFVNVD